MLARAAVRRVAGARGFAAVPRVQALLDGKLVDSKTNDWFPVHDPATGKVVAQTPLQTRSELEAAAESCDRAFAKWKKTPIQARTRVNLKLQQLIRDRTEDVAQVITRENGKTLADARGDVFRGLEVVEYACGAPAAALGDTSTGVGPGIDTTSMRVPIGTCAGIFAFNFPAMLPLWGFPLAQALGNAYLLKPSERTPTAGLMLAQMAHEAGLPPGVLNVVHGAHDTVNFLCDHGSIAAVSFVGSNRGGEHVYHRATAHGKRCQSNMGAKNHGVVMSDADMGTTLSACTGAAFGAAGQRCMALPVVILVGDAAASGVDALVSRAKTLKVGPGTAADTDVGPMISAAAVQRARDIVAQAVAQGAQLLLDGRKPAIPGGCEGGFYFGPTVLHLGDVTDPKAASNVAYTEEIFGPVQCVMTAPTLADATAFINRNAWGNGTALFTSSGAAARAFTEDVGAGQVGINVPIPVPLPFHSFTGNKRSFLGDLHFYGKDGVRFFTQTKTVTTQWKEASAAGGGATPLVMPTPGKQH